MWIIHVGGGLGLLGLWSGLCSIDRPLSTEQIPVIFSAIFTNLQAAESTVIYTMLKCSLWIHYYLLNSWFLTTIQFIDDNLPSVALKNNQILQVKRNSSAQVECDEKTWKRSTAHNTKLHHLFKAFHCSCVSDSNKRCIFNVILIL